MLGHRLQLQTSVMLLLSLWRMPENRNRVDSKNDVSPISGIRGPCSGLDIRE